MCPFPHSGPQSTEPKCWCVSSSHTSSSQFSPEQPLTPHHVPQIQNPQLSSRMLTFHFISPSLLGFPRVCCLLHTSWPPEVGRCVPTAGPPDYLVQNLAQECCTRVATKPCQPSPRSTLFSCCCFISEEKKEDAGKRWICVRSVSLGALISRIIRRCVHVTGSKRRRRRRRRWSVTN